MKLIADLHIHSPYSRATSPSLSPPNLERWALIKGIGLLGTGDCTHPAWLEKLRSELDDIGEGLYVLKKEVRSAFNTGPGIGLPMPCKEASPQPETPRFVLTGEIATIYKKGEKTRKIHHLIILPDFKAAVAFNARIEAAGGNIRSDGRPILGMDSRDLLAMLLEADERALLIPAHIWTPWFSVLGAKSGFDSIEECYRDLASHIPAVETGLSSNPPMNWALSALDKFSIISNSDAHSPEKLGREATILETDLSFGSLRSALFSRILGTIEFFPQEGKYHYDGHRKCEVSLGPEEAAAGNYLCPVCGKSLTRGVMGRVLELADRPVNEEAPCPPNCGNTNQRPYHSLIPLREIIAELIGAGAASKKAEAAYYRLIEKCGNEFSILMDKSRDDLEKLKIPELSAEILAEAIMKMRSGEVFVSPGYDGEYGNIRVFAPGSVPGIDEIKGRENLFGESQKTIMTKSSHGDAKKQGKREISKPHPESGEPSNLSKPHEPNKPRELRANSFTPDPDQEKAISHNGRETIIIAGPGTGKTAVLGAKIARIVSSGAEPASILALTFTIKAAAELRERILRLQETLPQYSGKGEAAFPAGVMAATFHSFCCSLLREHFSAAGLPEDFRILGEEERDSLLREIGGKQARHLGQYIEERKRYLLLPGETFPKFAEASGAGTVSSLIKDQLLMVKDEIPPADSEMETFYAEYRKALKVSFSLDFEDLSAGTVRLLAAHPEILRSCHQRFRRIFVDEYQDINFTQYLLIRLLASGEEDSSLCVIGDPNQAIYGFRGSDKRFIDRFLHDYPDAARFELSRSFRCAEPIISAAGLLAKTSLRGADKTDSAKQNDPGAAEVNLYRTEYPTEKSEAEGIARTIEALLGGTSFFAMDSTAALSAAESSLAPSDCAVLVRASSLADPVIKALKDHGIPFDFTGAGPWWKEEHAAGILEILRDKRKSPADPGALTNPADSVRAAWEEFSAGKSSLKKTKASELVERLISLAAFFKDIPSFLDTLDSCAASGISEMRLTDGVKVMTIHASKGLEFEQVFVPGLEEGILPFTLYEETGQAAERIEEERRLLYVAMTRAKRGLWLSWADSRTYRGRKLRGNPSRFLSELEKIIPLAQQDKPRKWDGQMDLF